MKNQLSLFIFLALALALPNLVWSNELLDPTLVPRFLCLSVILLLGLLFFRKSFSCATTDFSLNLLDTLFIFYYLISLASIFWSLNKAEAIFDAQKVLLLFAAYYVLKATLFNSPQVTELNIGRIIVALNYIVCGVSIYKIADLTGDYRINHETLYMVGGTVSHKNLLSILLMQFIPFNIIFLINEKNRWKWLALPGIALALLIIVVLQTRSVYLALGISVVIFFSYLLFKVPEKVKRLFQVKFILPASLSVVCILGAAIIFYASKGDLSNFAQRFNILKYLGSDTGVERLMLWEKTMEMIQHHWLAGVGKGGWKILFPGFGLEGSYRAQFLNIFYVRPHNDFLWVWSETGIAGLTFFIGIFYLALRACIDTIRTSTDHSKQIKVLVVASALGGYCIASFFDFPMERTEHQLILSLLFAFIVFYTKGFFRTNWNWTSKWITQSVYPAIILLLALNIIIGGFRYAGERETNKAIYQRNQGNWNDVKKHTSNALSPFYNMDPTTIPVMWYKGVAEFQTKNLDQAYTDFQSAYTSSPYNYHVLNNLGSVYVEKKEYQKAVDVYLKALHVNPVFDEAKFNIAIAYYHLGDYQNAMYWASQPSDWKKKQKFMNIIQAKMNQP